MEYLLCADTLYTDGSSKFHGEKIFPWRKKDAIVCFAVSGNATIAKMMVDDCKASLDTLSSEQCSLSRMFSEIRSVVKFVQEQYVDVRPIEDRENSRFWSLIAIRTPADGIHLFSTNDAAIAPVTTYDCIGAGRQLGLYILEPFYDRKMSINEAAVLAIYALTASKERVDGVGGRSQFIAIRGGILSDVIPHDTDDSERRILDFREKCTGLLFDIADGRLDDSQFEQRLKGFAEEVREIRAFWKGREAPWNFLLQRFSTPEEIATIKSIINQAAQQGPLSPTADPSPAQPSQESPAKSDES